MQHNTTCAQHSEDGPTDPNRQAVCIVKAPRTQAACVGAQQGRARDQGGRGPGVGDRAQALGGVRRALEWLGARDRKSDVEDQSERADAVGPADPEVE